MRHKEPLNDRHKRILLFLKSYIDAHGYSPSLREIGDAIEVSSNSLVRNYLMRLHEEGYITRKSNVARSIVVKKEG